MTDPVIRQYIYLDEFDQLFEHFSTNTSLCLMLKTTTLQEAQMRKKEIRKNLKTLNCLIYVAHFAARARSGPIRPVHFNFEDEQFFSTPFVVNLFCPGQLAWTWLSLMRELYDHLWSTPPKVEPLLCEIQQKAFTRGILSEPSYLIEIRQIDNSICLCYNFDLDFSKSKPLRFIPLIPTLKDRAQFANRLRPEILWDKEKFWADHVERVGQVWDELTPAEQKAFTENLTLN